jgi:spore germination cell wall hydrolase CwlJ-like protein
MTWHIGDPTGGATSYYAATSPEPDWVPSMVPTIDIGNHKFFRLA